MAGWRQCAAEVGWGKGPGTREKEGSAQDMGGPVGVMGGRGSKVVGPWTGWAGMGVEGSSSVWGQGYRPGREAQVRPQVLEALNGDRVDLWPVTVGMG